MLGFSCGLIFSQYVFQMSLQSLPGFDILDASCIVALTKYFTFEQCLLQVWATELCGAFVFVTMIYRLITCTT